MCASVMCSPSLHEAAAAMDSKRMCVQYLVLKGWKEKQTQDVSGQRIHCDGKGVSLLQAATGGWGHREECGED